MFEALKRDVNDVKRLEEIMLALSKHQVNLFKEQKISPENLRKVLEELGGSFIKLGQLLSLRPDLIPLEYCNELSKLQDSVKAVPTSLISKEFKKEFPKKRITLSKKPIGSASIAQVHTAVYKKKKIVIKIRKPGVKEKFETDLDILKKIAYYIQKKRTPKHYNAIQIFEEFEEYTWKELDFTHELQNLKIVAEKKHQNKITIPKPIEELSTESILAMEFIEGKKLSGMKTLSNQNVTILAKEFWDEIFEHGIFHADPHPGNILIGTKIGLIDWGIIGRLNQKMRKALQGIFFGIVLQDIEAVVHSMQKLNLARNPLNSYEFKRDIKKEIDDFYGKNLDELKAQVIFERMLKLMREYNFYIDKNYILLMKCVVTIEGVGLAYNKNFNLFKVAMSYVKSKTKKNLKEIAFNEIKEIREAISYFKRFPEEASSFFEEEIRQERLLARIKDDVEQVGEEVKIVGHEIILMMGIALITMLSIYLMRIDYAYLGYVGFVLALALLLNLIKLARR